MARTTCPPVSSPARCSSLELSRPATITNVTRAARRTDITIVLVLTRKPEQSIRLGDDITVTVLAIEGDRVKLGIVAPRTVSVLRQELLNNRISAFVELLDR
jgi:carbon storage regulator CsrA